MEKTTPSRLLCLSLVLLAMALVLWIHIVPRSLPDGPTRAALFTHLVPVFGALFGVLLLGERLGLHHLAGFALILAGIAVSNGLAGRLRGTG